MGDIKFTTDTKIQCLSAKKAKRSLFRMSLVSLTVLLALGCAGPNEKVTAKSTPQEATNEETVQPSQSKEKIETSLYIESESKAKPQTLDKLLDAVKANRLSEARVDLQREAEFGGNLALSSIVYQESFPEPINTENYQHLDENGVKVVSSDPVSTFSVDVDTGSYSNARRMLNQGVLPPSDAVRLEEFINYFDYQYNPPKSVDQPFSVDTALTVAPWNKDRHLLRIGLKGFEDNNIEDNGSNLVFLLDVSGSMNQSNKLPLLKQSLVLLSKQLDEKDSVSIVVYAGASGVVLEPTKGNRTAAITRALSQLKAGGSTNGAAGIELAYQLAQQAFIKDGVNRVVLATDGDFNVGLVDHQSLIDLIKVKRDQGIALTTLGFGDGNYNDHLMEQLADAGNGNYAYIDNINEARKVLVDEVGATMQMIAKDVKIQVEFNPATVAEYRLLGYENRQLANEDFNNDKVDAGDIGAGHTVTALYELTLKGSKARYNDELRYASEAEARQLGHELAHVKLRYKQPDSDKSQLISQTVTKEEMSDFERQHDDFRFAVAVAGFAQLMKKSKFTQGLDYEWVVDTANNARGEDEFGYRSEFVKLVRSADALKSTTILSLNEENFEAEAYSLQPLAN
jgi:Ca-activated chloride channel family protein